jgi:type 2 lantibiotic biosynthesis protein LanM
MRQGGWRDYLERYPVLARMLATAVDHWIEATAEFLERLDADWAELRDTLFDGNEPGEVTAIEADLSDAHNRGRTTLLLTFASGQQAVYKPRNLATEVNWFAQLGWLNERGISLRFRRLSIVDRTTHGWVEFAAQAPCASSEEARRYYRRTGMILALVYALGGNDCHFENIVAQGDQPILVDLETIMHPVRRDGGDGGLNSAIGRVRFESVLRTGMLPQWVPQSGGRALDTSALGAVNEFQTTRPQPVWREINTDVMRLERVPMTVPTSANAALIDGVPMSPNDYLAEIEGGFGEMYRLLIAERDALLAPRGPIDAMRGQPVRFIFRGTGVYYAVIERASRPDALHDGAARSIELDALVRPLLADSRSSRFWPLLAIERRDLERGDIPSFTVPAESEDVPVEEGEVIRGGLDGSCFAGAVARIRRLDAVDLKRQIEFIRATMQARVARHGGGAEAEDSAPAAGPIEMPSPSQLVDEAMAIAQAIQRDALGDPRDGLAWMTVRLNFAMERFHLEVSGPGLYDGACGIAVFLGMLHQVTGERGPRDLALAALAPLRADLRAGHSHLGRDIGIGGASGLGACVYGLVRAAALLDAPDLLGEAHAAALAMTPELIAEDDTYDVIGGAAGAILGLLSLHAATGDGLALERAVLAGRRLIDQQHTGAEGRHAWTSRNGAMLAGFAHGAAGIAYGLIRLSVASGDREYLRAAEDAVAYEDSLFSRDAGNWPDLRSSAPGQPVTEYAESWCNGGPGIGLARVGGLDLLDTPQIRAGIDAAMRVAREARGNGLDHLCCGHLGRADILLETGLRLNRPEWVDAGLRTLAERRHRARDRHGYRLAWESGGGVAMPGLFQGMSGIGYALLRAAYPGRFPSVQLWASDAAN